jgi:hypothetical protein
MEKIIKKHGFKATMLTWEKFCDLMECEFSDIQDKMEKKPIESMFMLYVASNDVYTKGNPTIKNEYEADDFFNELTKDEREELNTYFINSMKALVPEEEGKKK